MGEIREGGIRLRVGREGEGGSGIVRGEEGETGCEACFCQVEMRERVAVTVGEKKRPHEASGQRLEFDFQLAPRPKETWKENLLGPVDADKVPSPQMCRQPSSPPNPLLYPRHYPVR